MASGQGGHAVRFEWGATGGASIATGADCALVVDVLSFSTTVGIAVERGAAVIPYPSLGEAAETVAAQHGATLAGPRGSALSLSPQSMREAEPAPTRLVLPSPNGATVERWPDGSLRPRFEDMWGAGAGLAALEAMDLNVAPEAAAAADAYRIV